MNTRLRRRASATARRRGRIGAGAVAALRRALRSSRAAVLDGVEKRGQIGQRGLHSRRVRQDVLHGRRNRLEFLKQGHSVGLAGLGRGVKGSLGRAHSPEHVSSPARPVPDFLRSVGAVRSGSLCCTDFQMCQARKFGGAVAREHGTWKFGISGIWHLAKQLSPTQNHPPPVASPLRHSETKPLSHADVMLLSQ